ncbi:hypothetical protein [Photobacterium profundum]|nr:hypothetical protein [Photobacterium profundum]
MIKQTMDLIPGLDTTGAIDIDKVVQAYREVIMDSKVNGTVLKMMP